MNRKHLILFIAFVAVIVTGCEKELFDYRNKYLGHWNFVSIKNVDYADISKVDKYDSITYRGTIDYGEEDNQLLLQYSETGNITVCVNKDGIISGGDLSWYTGDASGEFTTRKKLNLQWWSYVRMTNPNLNISTTIEISGEKD